jgi:hypothetical protein
LALAFSSAVRRGLFVEPKTKINFSPGGAAWSFVAVLGERRPSVTERRYKAYFAPERSLVRLGGGIYKDSSPTDFAAGGLYIFCRARGKIFLDTFGDVRGPGFLLE